MGDGLRMPVWLVESYPPKIHLGRLAVLFYLTKILNVDVKDSAGKILGQLSDLAITTSEVFPRVSSLAIQKDKQPFVFSWSYVDTFAANSIILNVTQEKLRFSFVPPNEILLRGDLLDRQIVDTQGLKVVRVNDLKLSLSADEMRLLGADVGFRGILRRLSIEKLLSAVLSTVRLNPPEKIIPWYYMDLLEKDLSQVKLSVSHRTLKELHPADLADIIEQMDEVQRTKLFEHLDIIRAADAMSEIDPEVQPTMLEAMSNKRASDLLAAMDPDDAADIIAGLPYDKAQSLLNLMGIQEGADIRKLLGYKESTAGGIMTTDLVAIREDMTTREAIEYLRSVAMDAEGASYVYVVDESHRLLGVLSLYNLVIADPETAVKEIILPELITVEVGDDQEEVAAVIRKYDLLAVPVVDENSILLGIVTVDDVLDVVEEESDEDMSILAGSAHPSLVMTTTLTRSTLRRALWLGVWTIVGSALSSILLLYSDLIESAIVLAFFIPLVLMLSEDISTQSIALMLEVLKEGAFDRELVIKKTASDLGAGIIVAAFAGLVVEGLSRLIPADVRLSLIVALSLGMTIIAASIIGTILPFILHRLKIGLTAALGPLVTIVIGAIGLFAYLGVASLFR